MLPAPGIAFSTLKSLRYPLFWSWPLFCQAWWGFEGRLGFQFLLHSIFNTKQEILIKQGLGRTLLSQGSASQLICGVHLSLTQ